VSLVVVLIASI